MCCGRICSLCVCLILVVVAVGLIFGTGVYKDGFHKIKDAMHSSSGRPFIGYNAAPAPF